MIDLEREKKNFQNHVATFTDYGNIKILDFQRPGSNEYRIRFLFEEDYCRLHISGDLGELVASNYKNMVFELFERDYTNNTGYFAEKIDCMSRKIYYYDEEKAEKDIREFFEDHDYLYDFEEKDIDVDELIFDILEDFTDNRGIGSKGYDVLSEYIYDAWEYRGYFGKIPTGILDLYMMAFKLAMEQLREKGKI